MKTKNSLSQEKIDHIRKTAAHNAAPDEFKTFMYLCEAYDLDPLKKEIYFIKYGGKSTILTSRDGYLKIANTNPNFDGIVSDVVYQGDTLTKQDDGSLHINYGPDHLGFSKPAVHGLKALASGMNKDFFIDFSHIL